MIAGFGLAQFVQYRLGHGRREFLRGQAIASADHAGQIAAVAQGKGFAQGVDDIAMQRFAAGAGMLGAVQHGDGADGGGQHRQKVLGGKRQAQPNLNDADLFAARLQRLHGLAHGVGRRAHDHDHPLGLGMTEVVEQPVVAAGQFAETVHGRLDNAGQRRVEGVDGFTTLEKHVRVLRGAANAGMVRVQGPGAMRPHRILVDHGAEMGILDQAQLVHLMGGAEAIEEMHERNTPRQRGRLGNQRQVMGFLHGGRSQLGEPGAAHRRDIGMIAEDRQTLGGQRPGRDMKHRRRQLAGDLVHVGDHEQQALRGREGRRQGAGLQRAMHRAGGAGLALHFHHLRHFAPQVGLAGGGPLVCQFRHGRGGRDRIDRADFVDAIGGVGDGLVAVEGDVMGGAHDWVSGSGIISMAWQGHCSKHTAQPVQRS